MDLGTILQQPSSGTHQDKDQGQDQDPDKNQNRREPSTASSMQRPSAERLAEQAEELKQGKRLLNMAWMSTPARSYSQWRDEQLQNNPQLPGLRTLFASCLSSTAEGNARARTSRPPGEPATELERTEEEHLNAQKILFDLYHDRLTFVRNAEPLFPKIQDE